MMSEEELWALEGEPRRIPKPYTPLFNYDAFDYIDEKIPRRHGWWYTTNCRDRARKIALRINVARNSDSPIRDPDNPPKKPKMLRCTKKVCSRDPRYRFHGRRYVEQTTAHEKRGDAHRFVDREKWSV